MDPKLSPDDAVLIFGDIQDNISKFPLTNPREEILRSARLLAKLAELFDIPTIAMTIPRRDGTSANVVPEITQTRSKFTHIERSRPDSFQVPEIRTAIENTGRKAMIICGIATEIVVQWLALSGRARGYQVYLVVDACGGLGERSEQAAFSRMQAAGVVMTSVVSLAGEFSGDFRGGKGRDVINIVYERMGIATSEEPSGL